MLSKTYSATCSHIDALCCYMSNIMYMHVILIPIIDFMYMLGLCQIVLVCVSHLATQHNSNGNQYCFSSQRYSHVNKGMHQ